MRPGRDAQVDIHMERIQRARMIAAMVRVASNHGYAHATVGRVVADSGVSRRTFYEVFKDGQECFLAAFEASILAASRRVLDAYDPSAPWRVRVRAGLAALLEFLDDEPEVAQLTIVESLGAGPRLLESRRRALSPLIAAVDEGRGEAKGRSGDAAASPLTAEGVVGAVLSVLHARLVERGRPRASAGVASAKGDLHMAGLTSQLMSIVVLPYLGPAAARRELLKPVPEPREPVERPDSEDRLKGVPMRVTHRTMCVIRAIADSPGASNRQIGNAAGVVDQGQISKLLRRLEARGLLSNDSAGHAKGAPNAWTLTPAGEQLARALRPPDSRDYGVLGFALDP